MSSPLTASIARIRKSRGLRQQAAVARREVERVRYGTRFDVTQLRDALVAAGLRNGQCVYLQTSWDEFANFDGAPIDVIDMMLDLIGPTGTLAMPVAPAGAQERDVWNFDRLPSGMGLITELFRRYPGVERSIHLASSVAALGPEAQWLCADHHRTETAWDSDSPFARLRSLDSVQVGLGLYPFYSTPLHVVDAVLRYETEFHRGLFSGSQTYAWSYRGQQGEHTFLTRNGRVEAWQLRRFYDSDRYTFERLSNLRVFVIEIPYLVDHGLALGRAGITHYLTRQTFLPHALQPKVN